MNANPRAAANRKQMLIGIGTLVVIALFSTIAFVSGKALYREKGPSTKTILTKMTSAGASSYKLHITGTVRAKGDLSSGVALVKDAATAEIDAQFSGSSFSIDGTLTGAGGQTSNFAVLSDGAGFYLNDGTQWYGQALSTPLKEATSNVFTISKEDAAALEAVFDERSYEGEVVDGKQTWKLTGTLPEERTGGGLNWQTLSEASSLELLVDRKSFLPLQASFQLIGDPLTFMLVPIKEEEGAAVNELDVQVQADFSDWNQPIDISAPAEFKPLSVSPIGTLIEDAQEQGLGPQPEEEVPAG